MRIAYVSPYDWAVPGGVNRHIEVLADLMTALGHEVTIIAPASAPVTTPNVQVVAGTVSLPASGSQVRIAIDPRIKGRLDNIFADNRRLVTGIGTSSSPSFLLLPFVAFIGVSNALFPPIELGDNALSFHNVISFFNP